ncbi:MAG: class I tRNA ligase family protein [Candidatus Berkelbacteria bacterium]|nr:class I tRNA ligase family protein [Candidatus Berkelbacteria bacterium]
MGSMRSYDHQAIEKKWRQVWEDQKIDEVDLAKVANGFYCLDMFPYPSGEGLHVGHWRGYILSDYFARYYRLQGKTVLHPMGFDSFGLPAENAAIKKKAHPKKFTDEAIPVFIDQLKATGAMYDWSKTISTADPSYYRWTQWLFLQFFKHGLAEKRHSWVNWCPKDKTVLANEQVINGCCERCGSKVTKKKLAQWYLKITDFATELLDGLETLDWPENVKSLQKNWIGRSEGANVVFHSDQISLKVFTTRVDTLFGVTALVLAPEHPDLTTVTTAEYKNSVLSYVEKSKEKSELDRQRGADLAKTGVFTGSYALHPLTSKQIPIWVADYVLPDYGSGVVMLVPAHDQRDYDFARSHSLPVVPVIEPEFIETSELGKVREKLPFTERNGIVAIVKHWTEDKYLGLKWKNVPWGTWITGGIETGQSAEAAARTEILEEVGYKNLRLVKKVGTLISKFYHPPKQQNRLLHGQVLYFELENDERIPISKLEAAIHEPIWLSPDEILPFLTASAHRWAWQELQDQPALYEGHGTLINSGMYDGLTTVEAAKKIAADLERRGSGGPIVNYRLRDWLVSRQRYWGAPIPIVYDPDGTAHAVRDEHLPILLPTDAEFMPGGESPIKLSKEFQQRAEKLYGKGWHFETDTLDTFVDSSWYYLRFLTPNNNDQAFDPALVAKWLPVDLYIGGIEHAILHLLYSRFVYRFLIKYGYLNNDNPEPFQQLFNIGMITLHGAKMSKSKGNIVSPNELVEHYGTDALRGYELFLGPMENSLDWNPRGINGVHRFLIRVFQLSQEIDDKPDPSQEALFDGYLDRIDAMMKDFRLNTIISEAMILVNSLSKEPVSKEVFSRFIVTLSPAFPFLAEELWSILGNKESIFKSKWPKFFGATPTTKKIKILLDQRFIGEIDRSGEMSEEEIIKLVQASPELSQKIDEKTILRSIYKPGELLNLITRGSHNR